MIQPFGVFQFDQTTLGLPNRDYFLQPSNAVYLTAYKNYLITVVTLLGAPMKNAKKQADELICFEVKLANVRKHLVNQSIDHYFL